MLVNSFFSKLSTILLEGFFHTKSTFTIGRKFLFAVLVLGVLGSPHSVHAQCASSQKADILLLMDQSGSINNDKAWDATICSLVTSFSSKLRFGLMTFSHKGTLQVAIADNTATGICNYLNRSKPGGPSNMTTAFQDAATYWKQHIAKDPVKRRPRYTFFMTDKISKVSEPVAGARLLRALSVGGATYDVKTFAIGFGNTISLSVLTQVASVGGTIVGYHATSQSALQQALNKAAQQATQEVCDGIDNDCDGKVDENITQNCTSKCGPGTQTCSAGKWGACSASSSSPEICDNKDNDCDGQVDEGLSRRCYGGPSGTVGKGLCKYGTQTCSAGKWGTCSGQVLPKSESCNGADDDCDGQVDETFTNLRKSCSAGKGICLRAGIFVCNSAKNGTVCSATPGKPQTETCNNRDDDCDGQVDEGTSCGKCTNGQKRSCYGGPSGTAGKGICKAGTQTCTGGNWSSCVGQALPTQEICDGKDNNCNGRVDENLRRACKTLCGTGTETCSAGKWVNCSARKPIKEICGNKLDDDCNGQVDDPSICQGSCKNGQTRTCYSGSPGSIGNGGCKQGKQTCTNGKWSAGCPGQVLPSNERCDGKDNDCDGLIDESLKQACKTACGQGTEFCRKGNWEGCTAPKPTTEVCDGKDNDCNGKVDEIAGCTCKHGQARSCFTGDAKSKNVGVCKAGVQLCVKGKWETACKGEVKPGKEICDNRKDDDCDGKTDEDCGKTCKDGDTRPCPTVCGPGREVCKGGKWSTCSDAPKILLEVCDGKDNDCDGQVDEGLVRGCKTKCGDGINRCVNAKWTGCKGPQPSPEVCDGLDNDCDGKVDNTATCPGGAVCTDGVCPKLCHNGECPRGQLCKNGRCYAKNSCKDVTCKNGDICRGGVCVDPCDSQQCPSGFVCWKGKCSPNDCYSLGCPQGKVCRQGICVVNPCASISCTGGEYCKDGKCVKSCSGVKCGAKESCKEGKCVPDACAGVTCGAGKICFYGSCQADPCKDVQCPNGRVCVLGECKDDPCKTMKCSKGLTCQKGSCLDLCTNKKCPSGQACLDGNCVANDCYHLGCEDGKKCEKGKCIADTCAQKSCTDNAFCRNGQCVASCQKVKCQQRQICKDGTCEDDLCAEQTCDAGKVCVKGQCEADRCKSVTCGKGRKCTQATGKCEDDPCLNIQCPAGGICQDGQCVSACKDVRCPVGMVCESGACIQNNCYHKGCDSGKICKEAKCVDDPCAQKTCSGNEFCRDGQCVKSCAGVKCDDGKVCKDGACEADPCSGKSCPDRSFCNSKGECKPDPCVELLCGTGRVCDAEKGKCVDEPCRFIKCPGAQSCYQGQCTSSKGTGEDPGFEANDEKGVGQDGGNEPIDSKVASPGCDCQSSSTGPVLWPLLFLLFFFVAFHPKTSSFTRE